MQLILFLFSIFLLLENASSSKRYLVEANNGKSYLAVLANPKDYSNTNPNLLANPKDYSNANPNLFKNPKDYTNAGKATLLHVKYLLVKWVGRVSLEITFVELMLLPRNFDYTDSQL